MRLADFIAARGIKQAAIIRTMESIGMPLHQPTVCAMINGSRPFYPKARKAFRAALVAMYCDAKAVAEIDELKEPTGRRA